MGTSDPLCSVRLNARSPDDRDEAALRRRRLGKASFHRSILCLDSADPPAFLKIQRLNAE